MATVKRCLSDLARLSDAELMRIFRYGSVPDTAGLAGHEFRGYRPAWVPKVAGHSKFIKGFFWKDDRGERTVWGYGVATEQNGLHAPWLPKRGDDERRRTGWFRVSPVDPKLDDCNQGSAVCLDYGAGGNPIWDGARYLRDYVVQVDPDNDDLLLGRTCLKRGGLRLPGAFFILERA